MKASRQPQTRKKICQVLLLVALLFFCCATICPVAARHRCIFDSIAEKAGPPSTAVVRELPRRGRSGVQLLTASEPEWRPIRFSIFTEDINNESRYCTAKEQQRPDFWGGTVSCKEQHIVTPEKKNIILKNIIPQATKLHGDRLLVQPMTTPIVLPSSLSMICSRFTVPSSHFTTGVQNADMVLYAAVGPSADDIVAWSVQCHALPNRRPIVGVINLNPGYAASEDYFVRTAAHELAHVLGFNSNTLLFIGNYTWVEGVRDKPRVTVVHSRNVLEKTRVHFNCSTAPGMELEDGGDRGTVGSHWEMRNAKDELMASFDGLGRYTALTMALFEDLGLYRANWSMAETMDWGRNAGCEFLNKKCVTNGTTAYPDMFCTSNDKSIKLCTSDRIGLGMCSIKGYQNPIPSHYQYFANASEGGMDDVADFCPYILKFTNTRCTDGEPEAMPGSLLGPGSRCLKGNNLYYNGTRIGDVCADVKCNNDGTVSVRYLGSNIWYRCREDKIIKPTGKFTEGTIVCPKYSEVCFETEIDRNKTEVISVGDGNNDTEFAEEDGTVAPETMEVVDVNKDMNESPESTPMKSTITTGAGDKKNTFPTEGTSSNSFTHPILTMLGGNGANTGNQDASVATGFQLPLLLFVTALAFTILH